MTTTFTNVDSVYMFIIEKQKIPYSIPDTIFETS